MKYSVEKTYENVLISEGVYKLSIKGKFNIKPGQFFMLKTGQLEPLLPRPISVYDVDDEKISFLYQIVGQGTKHLSKLCENDEIQIMGPLGNGFEVDKIKGKIAVVSGGIGIAPLVYLIKKLNGCEIDLYSGFKTVDYSVDSVEKYVNKINLSTESGKIGHKGYITDILNPKDYRTVICCGPEIMMRKVITMCNDSEVPVYVSMENHMACGIGACLVCTCKTKGGNKRTCKDGPVFNGKDLIFND
ncbi:dihydroorotate dehydrogenase electron transfer subunit [Clostridium estertheticum]|uniref:dihydroorotate dehydrogenase electron transfer subunit n=1 Tax=Clostridium estertheticum TaxID=238834 RepID=UPI001C7DE654|nr:dihydroorotate dehydrogenase electron transfer subunit [Clostridium estertheticum]MBX4258336.1 dihydroorotate dehydrogenase electron transfer subunit [Clostridium estertheticum]WLC69701.1 dihydroorotate dehydrogenase electron transfer subunit [Clostridium estertheticum]